VADRRGRLGPLRSGRPGSALRHLFRVDLFPAVLIVADALAVLFDRSAVRLDHSWKHPNQGL
jgi:hypothetical protein